MCSSTFLRILPAVALASTSWAALSSHAQAQQPVTIELPGIEVSPARATKRAPRATTSSGVQPDEVVVSPTALPTPSTEIASSVTVITAREIEQQQRRTVPDVLRTVPGLNVVQSGGTGGLTSVFMRGTNSNHVKILIDGIDVSDPSNPGRVFDLGHLATADIERIEVLRGPTERALRRRRLGRRDFHHHQERRRTAQSHRIGGRRIVRHLQPGRWRQRIPGAFQLRLQHQSPSLDRHSR